MPPSVNDGRMIMGNCISFAISFASSTDFALPLAGTCMPILSIASLNSSLLSAFFIASSLAPINSTLNLPRMPSSARVTDKFRPVCPPNVGSSASGFSFCMIFVNASVVIGSIYVLSAISGSVIIVAGLLFTRMIL